MHNASLLLVQEGCMCSDQCLMREKVTVYRNVFKSKQNYYLYVAI